MTTMRKLPKSSAQEWRSMVVVFGSIFQSLSEHIRQLPVFTWVIQLILENEMIVSIDHPVEITTTITDIVAIDVRHLLIEVVTVPDIMTDHVPDPTLLGGTNSCIGILILSKKNRFFDFSIHAESGNCICRVFSVLCFRSTILRLQKFHFFTLQLCT